MLAAPATASGHDTIAPHFTRGLAAFTEWIAGDPATADAAITVLHKGIRTARVYGTTVSATERTASTLRHSRGAVLVAVDEAPSRAVVWWCSDSSHQTYAAGI